MEPQIVMDLADFVPEDYEIRFSVQGRKYVVRYGEAIVDEVFGIIAEEVPKDAKELIPKRRAVVTRFFTAHLAEGDAAQLEADLKVIPYSRPSAPCDIARFYEGLLDRVKKNEPGAM